MKQISWGWSIPDELLERVDLEMTEKVLLVILGRLGALEKPVFPRHQWLAQKMGMSESGIRKTINRLKEKGEISYLGRKWKIAKYIITDPKGHSSPSQRGGDSPTQRDAHKKEIQSKDIQINIISNASVAEVEQISEKANINKAIEAFKEVNPSYKRIFSNKTERASLERLLNEGEERFYAIMKAVVWSHGKMYAPIITTPYQLEKKMGELQAFIQRQQQAKVNILEV